MADYDSHSGSFKTGDVFTSENAENIDSMIHRLFTGNFPIQARIAKKPTDNFQFDVRQSNVRAWEYTDAGTTGTTMTFTVVSGSKFGFVNSGALTSAYLPSGTLLMNTESNEVVRVTTGANSGSSVTVVRGTDGGERSVTASNSTDHWIVIGSSAAEDASIGTITLPKMDRIPNYTQIFRTPWGLTESMRASRQEYGPELERQRFDMMWEHMMKREMAMVFGHLKVDAGNKWRTSRGFLRWITASDTLANNSTNIGGVLTESGLDTALLTWAQQSNRRGRQMALFCAPRVQQQITGFGRDRIQTTNPSTGVYGAHTTSLLTDWGSIEVVECPLWGMFTPQTSTSTDYDIPEGMALLLDLSDIKRRPLIGNGVNRDTHKISYPHGGATADTFLEELLTEEGYELTFPQLHHLFFGINAS